MAVNNVPTFWAPKPYTSPSDFHDTMLPMTHPFGRSECLTAAEKTDTGMGDTMAWIKG
jgi:hypothetical protein